MASKQNRNSSNSKVSQKRVIYQEFGNDNPAAMERAVQLPVKIFRASFRKGRKGKTVTVIGGFRQARNFSAARCWNSNQCGAGGTGE